jgi:hypothetical protein
MGFSAYSGGSIIPQDSVSGSVTFSSVAFDTPIQSLDFISLSIADHTYAPTEVIASTFSYSDGSPAGHRFDGALDGLGFRNGTNDFTLIFYDFGRLGVTDATYFTYVADGVPGYFSSNTGTTSIAAVPEVPIGGLLIFGLCTIFFVAFCRRHCALNLVGLETH